MTVQTVHPSCSSKWSKTTSLPRLSQSYVAWRRTVSPFSKTCSEPEVGFNLTILISVKPLPFVLYFVMWLNAPDNINAVTMNSYNQSFSVCPVQFASHGLLSLTIGFYLHFALNHIGRELPRAQITDRYVTYKS